jgi:hypothetical protein
MIEIQRARGGHSVIGSQDYFSGQSSNCSCRRYHHDLVELVNDVIPRENKNGPPLIGKPKRIPSDLATFSPHFLPTLRFPSKRVVVRGELVA